MKRFFMLSALVAFPVMAAFAPPRILASSVMNVTYATYDFAPIKTATIVLSTDNGATPTDIVLNYGRSHVSLKINDTWVDDNGCTTFGANLSNNNDVSDGYRFSLTLESDYGCQNARPTWTASVREGYGWCGTMDSTMELVGYPEWRMTN